MTAAPDRCSRSFTFAASSSTGRDDARPLSYLGMTARSDSLHQLRGNARSAAWRNAGTRSRNVSLYPCESRPGAGKVEIAMAELRHVAARMPGADARMAPFICRPQGPPHGLSKWRLKLVAGYVAEHLGDKVTLADMAAAARLSRMHFAALFLRATGLRPHEYLLRQRVAVARELLLSTELPIVEVALGVGFQTQAHFTTVFKRVTGSTPARWRGERRAVSADLPRHAQRSGRRLAQA